MIAGIDYSTHAVDIVKIGEDDDTAEWHRAPLVGVDSFERARAVRSSWFLNFGSALLDDVVAVGIETPRGYNSGSMFRVQGAVLTCIPRATLVQPWIPTEWRKAVGLSGRATKEEVATFVFDGKPVYDHRAHWTQDACDAYCIALATRSVLQRQEVA